MNFDYMSALRVGAVSVFIAIVAASPGCSTPAPKVETYVAPPLGSTWVLSRRDTGSFGTANTQIPFKRGEQTWQGSQYLTFEASDITVVAQPTGRWVGFFREAKPLVTWDPPIGYQWPLVVGKTWSESHLQTIHATQQNQRFIANYWVEAYEEIAVPAGTFKTFRVKSSDSMGSESLVWFSPDLGIFVKQSMRRTDKHPQGPGTREQQLVSQGIRK